MSIKLVTAGVFRRNLRLQIEHIGQWGRELFWQLPLFETHHSDLVTDFDIGVAGAIYAERRRSRLGFNKIWCMCRAARISPALAEREQYLEGLGFPP